MQNFNYYTPTRLIFGYDAIKSLPEVLAKLGKKVLITYGGASRRLDFMMRLLNY